MVRASGYLQTLDDFRKIPLMTTEAGVPVRVGDVVHVQIGPEMRRGIAELDGDGEVVGGVIVMRSGDAGNHDPVQATRSTAGRHDNRQAGRRAGPDPQGAGIVQHLGVADPQPHRHAGDWYQEPGLAILTERGAQIRLADVTAVAVMDGPSMLKSENARLSGWIYVDIRGRDLKSAVTDMQQAVAKEIKLPAGYAISWSGQFEYLERASAKLKIVVPLTLLIIFLLLYLMFQRFDEACLIMATLPLRWSADSGCCSCSDTICRSRAWLDSLRCRAWPQNSA